MTRLSRPALALGALFSVTFIHCGKKHDGSAGSARASASAPAPAVSSAESAVSAATSVASAATSAAPGATLPTISATSLRAGIRASGAKAAIVNAWASWCGPCREEVPMLQSMARNLKAQGVDVILVSLDEPEDSSKALAFLKSFEITLPVYLAERPLGPFKQGIHPRWPGMIPATFLFDATGKARYFWGGPVEENEIVPIVEGLLAGKAIDGESDFTLAPGRVEK